MLKDVHDLYLIMANFRIFKEFMKNNDINEEEFIGSKIPEDQYEYRNLMLKLSQLGDFTAKAVFDAMRIIIENKKLSEILERSIDDQPQDLTTNFLASILDFVDKRPLEGVFLSNTKIDSIEVGEGLNYLYLCIGYVDDFGNYYSEMRKVKIDLKKKRTIIFGSKWTEQAGNWEWLKKE